MTMTQSKMRLNANQGLSATLSVDITEIPKERSVGHCAVTQALFLLRYRSPTNLIAAVTWLLTF